MTLDFATAQLIGMGLAMFGAICLIFGLGMILSCP